MIIVTKGVECVTPMGLTLPFERPGRLGCSAVSLLGTASVGWLRSEVDMARIIDAARGAPAWVSAPLLPGTPTDSSARVIALTQPSVVPILCPCSTRLVGRSAGRVVDQDDANLPPTHDHPRRAL